MKVYKNKIKDKNLKSEDVDIIIDKINLIIKEEKEGHTEFSDDDIKELNGLKFLLKKYEENKEDISFTTQNEHLSHHKIKKIVNELELNQMITYVTQGVGGNFYFKITDRVRFRNYLYKLVEEIVNKLPEKKFNILKKINWYDPWIVTIGGTIIASLILLYLAFLFSWPPFTPKEPPRIEIDSISFYPTSFSCNSYSDFEIKYKIAHIGGGEVGFGQPYYEFINQTENGCLNNFTFFNSSQKKQSLCYNTFQRKNGDTEVCSSKFEPINKETVSVNSNQNQLAYNLIDLFRGQNITSCKIVEQVKICSLLNGEGFCSFPQEVAIQYNCDRIINLSK